jgi:chloramphenicol O-acetyltransferase type A
MSLNNNIVMSELNFDIKDSCFYGLEFSNFTFTSRLDADILWDYCKEYNYSFFLFSFYGLLKGINSVPELRRRIVDDKGVEYNKINGVTVLELDDDSLIGMEVPAPEKNESIIDWHNKIVKIRDSVLSGDIEDLFLDDVTDEHYAVFSCVPWFDFESYTPVDTPRHKSQPLITWGKYTDGKIIVALTCNHIFVNAKEAGLFFNNVQKYFNMDEEL